MNFCCFARRKSPEFRKITQKRSGDPKPQYFSKSTAVQMGGVLPYKWEAYCSTNGKRIAGFPFLRIRSLEARKVRRYKWGAYCHTNWRCTAVLFRQVVGVGVSETLPNYKGTLNFRRHDASWKFPCAPLSCDHLRRKKGHAKKLSVTCLLVAE